MLNATKTFSSFSTDDIEKARNFYQNILGLKVKDNKMGILELHTEGNNPIIIYPKGKEHVAAGFTVLNFPVKNVDEAVEALNDKGIQMEHYPNMGTDAKGIFRAGKNNPGPTIAWFKDNAGNILSILEDY